jgi:hypothetical protein
MIASVYIFGVYNGMVMPGAVHHKCYMLWGYLSPLFGTVACAASEAVDWITSFGATMQARASLA